MRPIACVALLHVCCAAAIGAEPRKLEVRVDPRVELLSIVFRLAGNPEYNMPNSRSPYSDAVEAHFGKFRDHPTVKLARELRRTNGISFDAVMSLAVHLDETMPPKLKMATDPRPPLLESRWTAESSEKFVAALVQFAADSDFESFLKSNRQLYEKSAQKLYAIVNRRDYVGWFDRFFGARPQAGFFVIVGMLCGGGNYGVSTRDHDGREQITPVIGIYKWDAAGLPAIGNEIVPTIVHEFCHSYTNAQIDQNFNQLEPAGETLYTKHCETMQRQAYGNARTVLYESLVRAVVTYYMQTQVSPAAGKAQAREEMGRGFIWTLDLTKLLAEYDRQRDKYKTFNDFMPRVIEFFNDLAANHDELLKKFPTIVSITPPSGATDVDPTTDRIVVTFDRVMTDQSWSVVGGGPEFPQVGKPSYDASRKVLTIPVKLAPAKHYRFSLNGGSFFAFVSADGYPLEPREVTFATRE